MPTTPDQSGGAQPWMAPVTGKPYKQGERSVVRVGLSEVFTGEEGRDLGFVREAVPFLEEIGFDTLWLPEHVVWFENYESSYPYGQVGEAEILSERAEEGNMGVRGLYDSLIFHAAAAMLTQRMRLGTYVLIATLRNPVVLARQVSTLDHLSNGRLNLGVGIGWSQEEYRACQIDFSRRGSRLDDYLTAMRSLWSQKISDHQGNWISFSDVLAYPKPIQRPNPPVYVGGQSRRGIRRAAELGDGLMVYDLATEHVEQAIEVLEIECQQLGRPPEEVKVVVGRRNEGRDAKAYESDAKYIAECAALGVHEVVCSPRFPLVSWFDDMSRYASAIELLSTT